MRQYLELKARYPDAILMFRMGDFYEMFFEDAVTVGPVLDIAVTTRDRNAEDPVPMAGVPYHAVAGYLKILVERGFKVAICEQLEAPEQARKRKGADKIVRRDVVRVVTPGALIDDEHLQSGEPNYLAVLVPERDVPGPARLALLDISSGEFVIVLAHDVATLRAELVRFAPREIVAGSSTHAFLRAELGLACPRLEVEPTDPSFALLERVRQLRREGGGDPLDTSSERAAALALGYAEATQPGQTLLIHRIRVHDPTAHLCIDETSLRNLEMFRTMRDGGKRGSLLWVLDGTRTAMGQRMLRSWLAAPLCERTGILARQDAIASLLAEPRLRRALHARLADVRDVVRLAARARLHSANPRELGALRDSLAALPDVAKLVRELGTRRTDTTLAALLDLGNDLLSDVHAELARVLVDVPPASTREGGIVRAGADRSLDDQRTLRDGGREALAAIEVRERGRTAITNLKVQHNRVFGYFIEVPRSQLARVPSDYVRKQTTANAERFVTSELAEHEAKVLGAQAAALERELELFEQLRERVSEAAQRICSVGERLACIDVLAALAELAESNGWVRPELVDEPVLELVEARHPVVERMLQKGRFVPNDVKLAAFGKGSTAGEAARLWIVTGPNMGGKSTAMRQTALVTILAQIGSYVPARSARIGIVDRVFTRVGAADDLGRGESTFMVEMRETAQILAQASARSLVLLDEIGRGTATFDGLAIAWAIVEHLHDRIACRAMFASHYHELCALEGRLPGVSNVHVAVHEERQTVAFLYRLEPGPAGRSYGIQVGRLAGLPSGVLDRAERVLERLEQEGRSNNPQLDLFSASASVRTPNDSPSQRMQMALALLQALLELDLDDLSPNAAHAWLTARNAELSALQGLAMNDDPA